MSAVFFRAARTLPLPMQNTRVPPPMQKGHGRGNVPVAQFAIAECQPSFLGQRGRCPSQCRTRGCHLQCKKGHGRGNVPVARFATAECQPSFLGQRGRCPSQYRTRGRHLQCKKDTGGATSPLPAICRQTSVRLLKNESATCNFQIFNENESSGCIFQGVSVS